MGICHGGGFPDLFHMLISRGRFPLCTDQAMFDIVENGALESNRLLLDKTNVSSEPVQIQLVDFMAV